MLKTSPVRSEKHRRFIASLPCCMTGIEGRTQAAHIRSGTGGGMGLKPSDWYCVPLAWTEHNTQHALGERIYWGDGIEAAKQLALDLHEVSGDADRARILVRKFRFKWGKS